MSHSYARQSTALVNYTLAERRLWKRKARKRRRQQTMKLLRRLQSSPE